MSTPCRLPPVVPGTRPELAAIEDRIVAERGSISPLYQTLLNSAPLAEGWERLLTALRNRSSVPPALREMVILRIAVLNDAPFEFSEHLAPASKAGLAESKIAALRLPEVGAPFTALERDVLALTDAMTRHIRVSDAVFAAVRVHFDDTVMVELVATVAAYNMVSRFLEALHIGH